MDNEPVITPVELMDKPAGNEGLILTEDTVPVFALFVGVIVIAAPVA